MKKLLVLVSLLFSSLVGAVEVKDGARVDADNLYPKVRLETSMGVIVVELNRYKAPITTNNFLRYVANSAYDNTVFHRIIPDFVVQGGGYDAEMKELPVYESIFNESGNGEKNTLYTIAMARQNQPHSAGRQFFINVADNDSLDPGRTWGYAVFGSVVEGMDVVDKMAQVETRFDDTLGWNDVPVQPVMLIKARVVKSN
ncbi:peptidylprolyl isomerase [Bowmanella sp. JS7-9]|uniref:Peptidyl-prolyl cis-trans isomerase n=1 Tax=Pseudobowmanella zhangzhouensis TaxID=1537679 RepID=A0ABW1XNQ5_9ALTE|nr:peptidylprolyl isomerase [Bowmanella sp. JS7-9]TBX22015.1 peptidylprolyl isomerase [Bowmanella sp. JS7-9]